MLCEPCGQDSLNNPGNSQGTGENNMSKNQSLSLGIGSDIAEKIVSPGIGVDSSGEIESLTRETYDHDYDHDSPGPQHDNHDYDSPGPHHNDHHHDSLEQPSDDDSDSPGSATRGVCQGETVSLPGKPYYFTWGMDTSGEDDGNMVESAFGTRTGNGVDRDCMGDLTVRCKNGECQAHRDWARTQREARVRVALQKLSPTKSKMQTLNVQKVPTKSRRQIATTQKLETIREINNFESLREEEDNSELFGMDEVQPIRQGRQDHGSG